VHVERDAGHENPLDVAADARQRSERLGDAAIPRRNIGERIADAMELDHARDVVDARQCDCGAARKRVVKQRARVPLAAKGEREHDAGGAAKRRKLRDALRYGCRFLAARAPFERVARGEDALAQRALGLAQRWTGERARFVRRVHGQVQW
jgi:hypothetical protein